ncbi:tyrosine-type recombinase/integrase [Methylorubrum thiocyanatum]|uniref:tyrosine-type recombinase/integrase n=1 Tax=Methylorubrum thiocyanatum TaxID=47958 RepID=UPI00398C7160
MATASDIHVFKPKNSPYYHCRLSIGRDRQSRSTGCRNERDAREWAQRWKQHRIKEAMELAAAPNAGMTFIQAIDLFMADQGDDFHRPDRHRMFFNWLLDQIGEDTPIADITTKTVAALVAKRSKDHRFGDPKRGLVSASYVSVAVVNPLAAALRHARIHHEVPLPREPNWAALRTPAKGRKRVMSYAEEEAILAVAGDLAPLIEFDILTALRRRDVLIKWSQVDWESNVIRVVAKGDKQHEIRITEGIRKLLDGAWGKHPVHVWTRTPDCGEHAGRVVPVTYGSILHQFKKVCRRAGVTGLTVHDLRRTAGERMYRISNDIAAVSEFMGHATIDLTRKHYVHVVVDDVEERQIAMEAAREKALAQRRARAAAMAPAAIHA